MEEVDNLRKIHEIALKIHNPRDCIEFLKNPQAYQDSMDERQRMEKPENEVEIRFRFKEDLYFDKDLK